MAKKLTNDSLHEILRVDHAGELGAEAIYRGQLRFTRDAQAKKIIEHMAASEKPHLDYFATEMVKHRVRPSLLAPLWKAGGFALGAVTAIMGNNVAMVCTEAVEEVINEHYAAQQAALKNQNNKELAELEEKIAEFRADEQHHQATAVLHGAQEAFLHDTIHSAIALLTRTAIKIAKKV